MVLPLVAEHVDPPLIAAGGICDARSGGRVWCWARWACRWVRGCWPAPSRRCDNLKQAVLAADETGTVLLPLGGGSGRE